MAAKNQYHKQKLREKEFKEKIFESMKAQYQRGLLAGSRAILKAVGDMIAEKDKSTEEKLADVMKFVNNALDMTSKTVEEAEKKAEEAKAEFDSLEGEKPAEPENVVPFPDADKPEEDNKE